MSIPLQEGIVYGPVRSRRLGRSLGVNVLPVGMKALDRSPALNGLQPASALRLKEIAERVRAIGIPVEVFAPHDSRTLA